MNTQQEIKLTYIQAPTDRNVIILKRDGKVIGTAKIVNTQGANSDVEPVWHAEFNVGMKKLERAGYNLPMVLSAVRAAVEDAVQPPAVERPKITADRLLEVSGLKKKGEKA